MRDGDRSGLRLERQRRVRRGWLRVLAQLFAVAGVSVILTGRSQQCVDVASKGPSVLTAQLCRVEFQRTGDPFAGELLAEAEFDNDNLDEARQLARRFLDSSMRGRALQLLGKVALYKNESVDAIKYLKEARREQADNADELAHDDALLANVLTKRGEFAEALTMLHDCIAKTKDDDREMECACRLFAATTLIEIGYFGQANLEINAAEEIEACTADNRVDLQYQRGNLAWESGHYDLAADRFLWVLQNKTLSFNQLSQVETQLNLANALARQGRFADARRYIDESSYADTLHQKDAERMWTEARLAFEEGALPAAVYAVEKYFARVDKTVESGVDRDNRIAVMAIGARSELARKDFDRAKYWAQQGVDEVEKIRQEQTILELRPQTLAQRREPYELLFVALAKMGRIEDAMFVFNQWQGRTVEDALTRLNPPQTLDHLAVAKQWTQLNDWLRVTSQAGFAKPADADAVLRTMRGIDLLALIVADGEVWRLSVHHGAPRLEPLEALAEIRRDIEDFRGDAVDVVKANELGALFIPNEDFRPTRERLYVIVDGRLGALPFAALRHDGTPLVALRPLEHLLRLPESRCPQVSQPGKAMVLVATDKLQSAFSEATQVANSLDTTPTFNATKSNLLDAKQASVLHVIAHGNVDRDEPQDKSDALIWHGGSLVLANQEEISAFEISASHVAPALVVLPVCSAAASYRDDLESAGSVTSGFLAAGAQHVVAPVRSVSDDGAAEVATKFYLAGGVANPARALAQVQAELAKKNSVRQPAWPYFTVFGRDVCDVDADNHP